MCKAAAIAGLGLLSISLVAAAQPKMLGVAEAPVIVDGPVIVGYFPRVSEKEMKDDNSGASEGVAHVSFALEDTLKCLKASGVTARAQLEMTKVLAVTDGANSRKIKLPAAWPAASGVFFFSPGKAPRRVSAQGGPSSLTTLAPEAAATYFRAPSCRAQ